jgi:hypothetical protein
MNESLQYCLTFVGCLAGIAAFLYFLYVIDKAQDGDLPKEEDDDDDWGQ